MNYDKPKFRLMGDRAFLVELGDAISPGVNQRVQELFTGLDLQKPAGVVELVPSYCSLLVIYDPLRISPEDLEAAISDLYANLDRSRLPEPRTINIPVVYGGARGPDLAWVADYHHLSAEEVIGWHTRPTYRVYMIGFTPGYPYLGELPDELATPRRATPRTRVPRGSVGIAQKQTGIYSVDSPGGWQIIGRTPLRLFAPERKSPFLYEAGDRIRFVPITGEVYERIRAKEGTSWTPSA